MNVVPLGEHVIIKRSEEAERTAGGIVLPDAARETPQQGRVLSVGDGRLLKTGERLHPQVREGDRVLLRRYSGSEVEVNGETLLIVNEDDILAILK